MLIDDVAGAELYYPLKNWARWAVIANNPGIGYPKSSPSCREYREPAGDTWEQPSSGIDEAEAETIDGIIMKLPTDLIIVVRAHYISRGTAKEKILKTGMTKRMFYDRLWSARRLIYVALVLSASKPRLNIGSGSV